MQKNRRRSPIPILLFEFSDQWPFFVRGGVPRGQGRMTMTPSMIYLPVVQHIRQPILRQWDPLRRSCVLLSDHQKDIDDASCRKLSNVPVPHWTAPSRTRYPPRELWVRGKRVTLRLEKLHIVQVSFKLVGWARDEDVYLNKGYSIKEILHVYCGWINYQGLSEIPFLLPRESPQLQWEWGCWCSDWYHRIIHRTTGITLARSGQHMKPCYGRGNSFNFVRESSHQRYESISWTRIRIVQPIWWILHGPAVK